jgi:hypothetical protein
VPAVLALPTNSSGPNGVQFNTTLSRPSRRNNPQRTGITTPLVPQQQMGIFPPMQTLGTRRMLVTNRKTRATQPRSIMTNYSTAAPVTAKTLKNRKKRDKKKLKAAGFPAGGYTITM